MKRIKISLTLLLLVSSMSIFAQLNPIKNLNYQQTYSQGYCPESNCFVLSWNKPDSSKDSLKGYKIYKNKLFWRFTSQTEVTCNLCCPCPYDDFYVSLPFWLKVKAVYNRDSVMSIANDSVHVFELADNIKEINKNEFLVIKNPVKTGENISLLIPNNESDKCLIQVASENGQLIKEYALKRVSNSIINISTNQLSPGLYFINIQMDSKMLSKKLMIE